MATAVTNDTVVRARISSQKKQQVGVIFSKLGITDSQAINMFYSKILITKGIPFDVSLEENDRTENYTKIKSSNHLKKLLAV
ncbi:MAG: type II toxin-antitoxin system RelB/DinJ family antitoxin [Patescibacteria group bacterium]